METMNFIDEVLRRNQLSVTDSRKKILELFQANNGALSHNDIEKKTDEKFDRVTVYRTLQTFLEKGIIHTIPTAENAVLYALCKHDCSSTGYHHDNHIHFICDHCNVTYCLDSVVTPEVNLPEGFKPKLIDVVVTGMCKNC
ncbi:MAG: transcriptional repressor [Bacteroidota bacterium]|nr:transcriptional repressor [Bacteroidota bacterium]